MLPAGLRASKVTIALALVVAVAVCYGAFELGWLGQTSVAVGRIEGTALSPPYSQCRAAILNPEYSARFFHTSKPYDAHADYWRKLLTSLQMPMEVISDARLEAGLQGVQTLVMPAAICLSKKERASLREFLANGGGLICTWATGARDESGAWLGLDFLREITAADSFEFTQRNSPWYVGFAAHRPTTAGVPGGFRVQVDSPDRMEAKALNVDAFWTNSRLLPVDGNLPLDFQGAMIHNAFGKGRIVWLGFQEDSAVAGGDDQELLDHALTNALVWTAQQPLVSLDLWPSASSAAAVFACDVEENADNAAYAASTLRKAQAKATFFCNPGFARQKSDLLRQLVDAGEIAFRGDDFEQPFTFPGSTSSGFLLPFRKFRFGNVTGIEINSVRPVSNALEQSTLKALAAARMNYVLVGPEGRAGFDSVLPRLATVTQSFAGFRRGAPVITLTRTADDDLHFSPLGVVGLDSSWVIQRASADFDVILALGGLYVFNFHSQGVSAPELVGCLAELADEFHQKDAWIGTAGDVASWWQMRSQLSLDIARPASNGIRLSIRNNSTKALENVTVSVYPPADLHARIVSVDSAKATAEVAPDKIPGRLTIRFGKLSPHTSNDYDLAWIP